MTDSQNEESISIVQLTQTDSDREIGSLVLSEGFVTWGYSIYSEMSFTNGTKNDVYLFDGVNTFALPDNGTDSDREQLQISGNHVTWVSSDLNDLEIYLYDGINTIGLTNNDYDDRNPQILGNRVVWSGFDGNDDEIFLYDGTETIQLTDNDLADTEPLISEDYIAWKTDSSVLLYDGTNTLEFSDNYNPENPIQLSENNLVWYDNNRISLYDGNSTIELTDNYTEDYAPQLSGDKVVWSSNDGLDNEIYFYDGNTTIQLTNNNDSDRNPLISGDNVVWSSFYEDVAAKLYVYDGTDTTLLDDINSFYDSSYLVSDRYVAWQPSDYPPFYRLQNTQNNTFLHAGSQETASIENDPNLSNLFVNQGFAFNSLI